ncbi:GGDEF domain-containing protein [Bacillus sp. AFS073361]|uniref:sensor domain-containing diguanylate cyclase n=1 Tax=Bacillus sp. AFS073361 TaxID=2033511 RepID=UPI000BF95B8B|nr:diguanylate cyclase [Bacillus sp. AFS073361]PFP30779.1 GGDEF domain-containing protein [Bacillus sp. AFS073361]
MIRFEEKFIRKMVDNTSKKEKEMEHKNTYSLINIPTTLNQQKNVIVIGIMLFLLFIIVIPFGTFQMTEIKPFLPIFIAWIFFAELITSFLLYSQFLTTGKLPLLLLASSFLYSCLITVPLILTFPGVFSEFGLLGAGKQTAIWLWVFWHGGFPFGLLLYGLTARKKMESMGPKKIRLSILLSVLILSGLLYLIFLLATKYQAALPEIIKQGDYRFLITSGIGPFVWLINLSAFFILAFSFKGRDVLNLWLTVSMFAFFLDVTLTLFAGARYSLGWYAARVNSLLSATVVLSAFVFEMNRLYIQLVRNQNKLRDSECKLKEMNERLKRLSSLDGLTQIANRRSFDETFLKEWKRGNLASTQLSMVLFDIDYFKKYNDHYGHQGGDYCLKVVAAALAESVQRPEDFVARYGGEEFVIILPNTDRKGALYIAERIRQSIEDLRIPHPESTVSDWVTISVGVATCFPGVSRAHKLIADADKALYSAKKEGRNRVKVY